MNVKVLIENGRCNKNVKSEHGLSLLINHEGRKILFDTGATGVFIDNAYTMGETIDDIDYVVISHAHLDHTGGLMRFLEKNKTAKVYMSRYSKRDYYAKVLCFKFNVGIPSDVLSKYEDRIIYVDDLCEVVPGTYLVPNTNRRYSLPLGESSRKLFVKIAGKYKRDQFNHELSLVIKHNEQLEIITGCSHKGISNMVEHVKNIFPNQDIHTVIGGFHLMGLLFKNRLGEKKKFIFKLADRMGDFNINKIYTTHCTGDKAYQLLKARLGSTIDYLHTGASVEL